MTIDNANTVYYVRQSNGHVFATSSLKKALRESEIQSSPVLTIDPRTQR